MRVRMFESVTSLMRGSSTRWWWLLMPILVLFSGAVGAVLMTQVWPARHADTQSTLVRGHAFEINDSAGRARTALLAREQPGQSSGTLEFYDQHGYAHVYLGQFETTSGESIVIAVRDHAGQRRVLLEFSSDNDRAGIIIRDAQGALLWTAP